MPRYLFKASYTKKGAKGVLAKGGAARRDALAEAAKSAGGKMESFDFAFGGTDAFVVCDLPDNATAARVALAVAAAGGASVETVVLIAPDDIPPGSAAEYTPPGG